MMPKELILEFKPKELMFIGKNGLKMHVRRNNNFAMCGQGGDNYPVRTSAISFTEKCPELCQNCLREYKKEMQLK